MTALIRGRHGRRSGPIRQLDPVSSDVHAQVLLQLDGVLASLQHVRLHLTRPRPIHAGGRQDAVAASAVIARRYAQDVLRLLDPVRVNPVRVNPVLLDPVLLDPQRSAAAGSPAGSAPAG